MATADLDRRFQVAPHQQHQQVNTINNKMATAAYGTTGRMPLQSRMNSGSLSSSGDLNRLSTLEASNNENNKARMGSFSNSQTRGRSSSPSVLAMGGSTHNQQQNSHQQHAQQQQQGGGAYDHPPVVKRSESVGRSERGRSISGTESAHRRSTSTSAARKAEDASDNENVIIEEKRRRVNGGEGYTLHRYLRGRLLGRGGFAKVYLCTALDTSKNYAVKIVPKANLVKARARQKVSTNNNSL